MERQGGLACIDLTGTILEHSKLERPVPLMPQALDSMASSGWQVVVVTRFGSEDAWGLIRSAGVAEDIEVVSADNKADAVRELLKAEPEIRQMLFVDDKPINLERVCEIDNDRLRPIGFVGSHKYCPALARACRELDIEIVFSAPDLAETVGFALVGDTPFGDLSAEEWASLIPGLDHPFSAIAGETIHFDHRMPFAALRKGHPEWWKHVWPQLAWISCNECLWKALVESAVAASGLDRKQVLGDAYKHYEYTERLVNASQHLKGRLAPQLAAAMNSVIQGIGQIGLEAEKCRPAGRRLEPNRIEKSFDRLHKVYGKPSWLHEAEICWSAINA